MADLEEPPVGLSVLKLASYVRDCIRVVRSLRNMQVAINNLQVVVTVYADDGSRIGTGTGRAFGHGKLQYTEGNSKLVID